MTASTPELHSRVAKSRTHFLWAWESCEYETNTFGIFIAALRIVAPGVRMQNVLGQLRGFKRVG